MEHERHPERAPRFLPGGSLPDGSSPLEEVQAGLQGAFDQADQMLDAIAHLNTEQFLQQQRQRGGQ